MGSTRQSPAASPSSRRATPTPTPTPTLALALPLPLPLPLSPTLPLTLSLTRCVAFEQAGADVVYAEGHY